MYLIGRLPQHVIVFEYGQYLTQKRKQKAAQKLLEFTSENYDLPEDHLTIERSLKTINNELRFGKYKLFKRKEDGGYKTENSTRVGGTQPIIEFDIE